MTSDNSLYSGFGGSRSGEGRTLSVESMSSKDRGTITRVLTDEEQMEKVLRSPGRPARAMTDGERIKWAVEQSVKATAATTGSGGG